MNAETLEIQQLRDRAEEAVAILTEFTRHFSGDGVTRAIAVLEGRGVDPVRRRPFDDHPLVGDEQCPQGPHPTN